MLPVAASRGCSGVFCLSLQKAIPGEPAPAKHRHGPLPVLQLSHTETPWTGPVDGTWRSSLQTHTHAPTCTHTWSAHIRTCCKMCFNEEQLVWFCSNKRYPCKRAVACLTILQCGFQMSSSVPDTCSVAGALQPCSACQQPSSGWQTPRPQASHHFQTPGHAAVKGVKLPFPAILPDNSSNRELLMPYK